MSGMIDKLCPFISGIVLIPKPTENKNPILNAQGQMELVKDLTVAPCMKDKCNFWSEEKKGCIINCIAENIFLKSSEGK